MDLQAESQNIKITGSLWLYEIKDSYDFFMKFTGFTSNGLLLGSITQIAISEESMEEAGLEWNSALTAAVTMATEEGVKKDSEEISGTFL